VRSFDTFLVDALFLIELVVSFSASVFFSRYTSAVLFFRTPLRGRRAFVFGASRLRLSAAFFPSPSPPSQPVRRLVFDFSAASFFFQPMP